MALMGSGPAIIHLQSVVAPVVLVVFVVVLPSLIHSLIHHDDTTKHDVESDA